ncbi:Alpha/Beta hydrolase protein, partial [Chytridium lagenaria]
WDFQSNFFAELEEYEVCVFDNRGIGFSTAPKGRYTTRMMALDTWELLQHLKWKRAHVVGLSMGGMIAQELSLHVPDAILSLALVSTTPGRTIPPVRYNFQVLKLILLDQNTLGHEKYDGGFASGTGFQIDDTDYLSQGKSGTSYMYSHISDRVPRPSDDGVNGQRMACYTHFVSRARLRKLRDYGIPIIVLTGDDDILVRPGNSIYLARNLRARLEIFVGGGHGLAVQFPERFNKVLLKHFRRSLELRPLPLDEDDLYQIVPTRPPGKPTEFIPSLEGIKIVPQRLRSN